VRPQHIAPTDSIDIEVFVSRFGSLAQACLYAGCDYRIKEPDPDIYAAGHSDIEQRQRVIENLIRIVEDLGHSPTKRNLKA